MELFGFGPAGWGWQFVYGLLVTIEVALLALPIGLVLGITCALGIRSPTFVVAGPCRAFANGFQAVPEILTIFAIYHGSSQLMGYVSRVLDLETVIVLPAMLAGSLALGLVFAAYSSEVWRGALEGVSKGQREAGAALGLHKLHLYRLIVMPQAYKIALPGLLNLWLVLLKDTALVSVVAVTDLMRQVNLAVSATDRPFSLYLFACLVYVAISLISSVAIQAWTPSRYSHKACVAAGR